MDDDNDGDATDEGWPYYNSEYDWEWAWVYEMSINVSGWDEENITIDIITAHNSPSKDGERDVPIPPIEVPEFEELVVPTVGMIAIFTVIRRRKRKLASKRSSSGKRWAGFLKRSHFGQ